ncbi:hypothetical protein [Turicibacter sanguinis]|uniref:hypothetical protein n=1 Tax=Turicibacter sanguinis TaxID=154288 RepID=UPI0023311CBA|nr:hypothetical protein [Turicibacter sanguinis]MDB8575747.1 hypothetical protein [Turicibacter sanguinis]MDB8579484.1 hypothetical protein [Turicibacter sanguinis]MDB8584259.1 hypothetical protein [Turicibacter sanguinis]MDB8587168.1 hypothetical protein [Turicibacter sanguinis]MDB8598248.1 hypothetical protein [Turicibacter sanguinis]
MTENKKTSQDVRGQGELYPTSIVIEVPIVSLKVNDSSTIISSDTAVKINLNIDSPTYQKEKVKEAINLACLKLREYFC